MGTSRGIAHVGATWVASEGTKSVKCHEWHYLLINWLNREKGLDFAWLGLKSQHHISSVQSPTWSSASLLSSARGRAELPVVFPSDTGRELAPAAQGSGEPHIAEHMTPRFVLALGPAEQQGMGL